MARRKKRTSWNKDLLNKLKTKVDEAKVASSNFSKIAKEKGPEYAKVMADKSKKSMDRGFLSAKNIMSTKKETIVLIEKLAELKSAGHISEKEFQQKKKELLSRL